MVDRVAEAIFAEPLHLLPFLNLLGKVLGPHDNTEIDALGRWPLGLEARKDIGRGTVFWGGA